jgi:hypothetical protein
MVLVIPGISKNDFILRNSYFEIVDCVWKYNGIELGQTHDNILIILRCMSIYLLM